MSKSPVSEETFEDLCDALDRAINVHQKLRAIAEEKKEALIQLDYDRIETMVRAEEKLIERVSGVENHRVQLSIQAANELGLDPEVVSLFEIARDAPEPYGERLKEKRETLRNIMQSVRDINETNYELGEQERSRTEEFLHVLVGSDEEEDNATYTSDVRGQGGDGNQEVRLIDERV